jgi:hypothetical protein
VLKLQMVVATTIMVGREKPLNNIHIIVRKKKRLWNVRATFFTFGSID